MGVYVCVWLWCDYQDCREKGRVEGRNAHYSELLETKQYKDRHGQSTYPHNPKEKGEMLMHTLYRSDIFIDPDMRGRSGL